MTYLESKVIVPPSGSLSSSVWIVGESPGKDEVKKKSPFVGKSGEKLFQVLATYGISRKDCYITNLCSYQPLRNSFSALLNAPEKDIKKIKHVAQVVAIARPELIEGIQTLIGALKANPPKIILALGRYPSLLLTAQSHPIGKMRGSVYPCSFLPETLVLCSYHPSYILRNPSSFSAFDADLYKLSRILKKGCVFPAQSLNIDPSQEDIDRYMKAEYLAVDIETPKFSKKNAGMLKLLSISFAISPYDSIAIAPNTALKERWIRDLLESDAKKIFHNGGSFDLPYLESLGFNVNNYTDDTIVQSHVLYPELPRDLGFLTSVYTDMPYYKAEGEAALDTKEWSVKTPLRDLLVYNCKDTCATFWVFNELNELIQEDKDLKRIYEYEMDLTIEVNKIAHLGLKRDPVRHAEIKTAVEKKIAKEMRTLQIIAGDLNPNSPKQVCEVLYSKYKLPRQFAKRADGTKTLSSGNDALIVLLTITRGLLAQNETPSLKIKEKFIETILELRELNKMLNSQINVIPSKEGRVRGIYKVPGTESGRLSSSKFIDGTGMNVQTITRDEVEVE